MTPRTRASIPILTAISLAGALSFHALDAQTQSRPPGVPTVIPHATMAEIAPIAPPAAERSSLTLEQALSIAANTAPSILLAVARHDATAYDAEAASTVPNPSLTVGSQLQGNRLYFMLNIPLPVFGQLGAAADLARSGSHAASLDIDVARNAARYAVTLSWIDLWLAEVNASTTQATALRADALLSVARERFSTGTAPRIDVVRATAQSARTHAEALSAGALVAASRARLAVWLGHDPMSATFDAAGDPPGQHGPPSLDVLAGQIEHHPRVQQLAAQVDAAQSAIALEERQRAPAMSLQLGAGALRENQHADFTVALTVELPVMNRRGPQIARARSRFTATQEELGTIVQQLTADLVSAYATLNAAALRNDALRTEVLPATLESAEMTLASYRAGRADINTVVIAEQSLADTRVSLWQAIADKARAYAALEFAAGGSL